MDMPDFLLKPEFKTTNSHESFIDGRTTFKPLRPQGQGWVLMQDQFSAAVWFRVRLQQLTLLGRPLTQEPSEYELAIFRSIGAYIQGQKE